MKAWTNLFGQEGSLGNDNQGVKGSWLSPFLIFPMFEGFEASHLAKASSQSPLQACQQHPSYQLGSADHL